MRLPFACPICTTLDFDRALCAHCVEQLWRRREPTVRDLGAYQTRGLFAWRRDGWLGLRWWATQLKGKEHPAFWREAAAWFTDVFGYPPVDATLVPVPGATGQNHALGLARAVSALTGIGVDDVLGVAPKTRPHQRRLGLFARRGRRYRLVGEVPRGPVIVIDDVITSGATVEAAYRALGQPARFEAWALLDRRPKSEV